MRSSIFLSLFTTCAFLVTAPSYGMDSKNCPIDDDCGQKSIVQATLSFEDQVENVKKFSLKRNEENLPIKMVMGARNNEYNIDIRIPGDEWIFFDVSPHDPQGRPHIQASFNDLNKLSMLATSVGPSFQQIVLDSSTFKDSQWTPEHIKVFASMLKLDGEFIFSPFVETYGFLPYQVIVPIEQLSQKFWNTIKDKNGFTLDKIQPSISLPFVPFDAVLSFGELNDPEVEKIVQQFKPLNKIMHLGEEEFELEAEKLGFICTSAEDCDSDGIIKTFSLPNSFYDYEKETIADQEGLRETIAYVIKDHKIIEHIRDTIHNPYVISFLEPYFLEITVKKDGDYPFSTNYHCSPVIYAKNPK